MPEGVMGDVYEGKVWRDFQYVDGQPFLADRCNFALMMNVDWHRPFEQSPYSVGVISRCSEFAETGAVQGRKYDLCWANTRTQRA